MEKLRADELLPLVLAHLTEPIEIVAADGTMLGRFTPDSAQIERLRAQTDSVYDPAEVARQQMAEGPARTSREVFEYLLGLAEDPEEQAYLKQVIEEIKLRDGCPTR